LTYGTTNEINDIGPAYLIGREVGNSEMFCGGTNVEEMRKEDLRFLSFFD
jgi:hypothetical protein